MLLKAEMSKVRDFPAALEAFRTSLSNHLKYERDHDGEQMTDDHIAIKFGNRHNLTHVPTYNMSTHLGVDYHPNQILAHFAKLAGIPESAFGCKNDVSIDYRGEHVMSSFGYGTPYTYHYPLEGDMWLVTTAMLQDDADGRAIKHAVQRCVLPLTVERACNRSDTDAPTT